MCFSARVSRRESRYFHGEDGSEVQAFFEVPFLAPWSLGCFGMWAEVMYIYIYLEPQTTIYKQMFGETTISYVKIGNHPIETTIYKWLFGVPGIW